MEEVALSNRKGEQSFATDPITSTAGTLETNEPTFVETQFDQASETIKVRTRQLDDYIDHGSPPAIIKIGDEGHEPPVLRGARRTLVIYPPVVIAESFPPKREEAVQLLEEANYSIWDAETLNPIKHTTNNLLAVHPAHFPETLRKSIKASG